MINKVKLFSVTTLLLLFLSCDAILDSFYPDFAAGERSIVVELTLDNSVDRDNIKVILVPMTEVNKQWIMDFDMIREEVFYGIGYISDYEFDNLNDTAYRVFAFQDKNDNGVPDYDEPSVSLVKKSNFSTQPGLFDFRGENTESEYEAAGYLGNYPAIEARWLEEFNQGETEKGDYIDRSFTIGESQDSLVRGDLRYVEYWLNFENSNVTFNSIKWRVLDEYSREEIYFNYSAPETVYENFFWIDYSSSQYLSGIQGDMSIILEVEVDFGNNIYKKKEKLYSITDSDYNFDIFGPNFIDRSADANMTLFYDINFRSSEPVSYIDWALVNYNSESIIYDGNFYTVLQPYETTIQMNTALIEPSFNDPWWDNNLSFFLDVYVQYQDGTEKWNRYNLELGNFSVGADKLVINGSIQLPAYANSQAFIVVYDKFDFDNSNFSNPLFEQPRILDANGETDFEFDIFDPSGLDQVLKIIIPINSSKDYVYFNDYSLVGSGPRTVSLGILTSSYFIDELKY